MSAEVLGRARTDEQAAHIAAAIARLAELNARAEDAPFGTPAEITAIEALHAAEELLAQQVGLPEGFRLRIDGQAYMRVEGNGYEYVVHVNALFAATSIAEFLGAEGYLVMVAVYLTEGGTVQRVRYDLPAELGAHADPEYGLAGNSTHPARVGFSTSPVDAITLVEKVVAHMTSRGAADRLAELAG